MITHSSNFAGNVQSLGFEKNGWKMTTGVILPGNYNFGPAEHRETIKVTFGHLRINGQSRTAGDPPIVVEKGVEVRVDANEESSYVCEYGE